ncbi:MAG: hypothetical protein ACXVDW_20520, partial [Bacteroidia bacterium]
ITLSTASIGLTITFTKDILKGVSNKFGKILIGSWFVYLLSIVFGIWTLMSLTGTLIAANPADLQMMSSVRLPATMQILSFITGTGMVIWYGMQTLRKK